MNSDSRRILAIAGFVSGLLSLVAWLLPICGAPLAVSALALGFLGRHSSRRTKAVAGMITSAIGLALVIGNMACAVYLGSTDELSGSPLSEDMEVQVAAAEKAAFARSYPDLVATGAEMEFRHLGRLLPQDRADGITMLACYQVSISFMTADGSCRGSDLSHGILALMNRQWNYNKYARIDFDTWAEHWCGDFALRPPQRCRTPTPAL